MKNRLLISTFCLFSCFQLAAQSQETPQIINFTKETYQAYNQNWAITQAPNDNMLFANSAGLLEFDGVTWRRYPLPHGQIARSIAIGKDGRIFTGAFGEFGFWKRNVSGALAYESLTHLIKDEVMEKEEIWHILPLEDAVLFQSFSAIYLYDYEKILPLKPSGNVRFAQKINGRILLPLIHQGLFELQNKAGFKLLPGTESLTDMTVVFLLPYQEDNMLIGTANNGIFLYQNEKLIPWNARLQDKLKTNQLNKGVRLSNGNFAFGTILNGVYLVDANGNLLYHINQQNGLQNNTVLSLFEDRANNLWVGMDKGIDLIEINSPLIFFKDKNGNIGSVYTAAVRENELLIGSNQGLFIKPRQRSDTNRFRLISGSQGQVWEIKEFDGQFIIGHNDGTFVLKNNHLESISEVSGGWVTLRHPQKPDILIQGTYAGLVVFTKDARGNWQFSHQIEGLGFDEPIKKMQFDADGSLWAANPYRGLYRIELDDQLQSITSLYSFTAADGLPSDYKIDIARIGNQVIIRSKQQFFTFDTQREALVPLTHIRGVELPEGEFHIKGGENGAWFQIYQHQIVYHERDNQLTFDLPLVPDFESIVAIDKGNYLFGLDDGYAIFDPGNERHNAQRKRVPAVRIAAIQSASKRTQHFYNTQMRAPQLAAKENNIHFKFSQPVFTINPKFSFKLEGFETDWSPWQSSPEKEYNRLPPGKYTFMVRSNLSDEIAQFTFTIKTPWYQSWWALVLYIIAFGMGIWLVERWNLHRLERQRLQLEQEKEKQLEEERIKTTNEKLQLDLINKSKELANSTMTLVKKNELLMKIKEEIRNVKSSPDGRSSNKSYQRLLHLIDTNISSEEDWQLFETNFNQVHEQFLKRLKTEYPDLTPGDLRLAAYLKMNLTSKEIAPLLNISIRSVENKRYRLRKKLNLAEEDNLTEFMLQY